MSIDGVRLFAVFLTSACLALPLRGRSTAFGHRLAVAIALSHPAAQPRLNEPAVPPEGAPSRKASRPRSLVRRRLDGVGMLPPRITGLPRNLWGLGRAADIEQLLAAGTPQDLPALQGLLLTVLLAEAEPPADVLAGRKPVAGPDRQAVCRIGALDQARALLDAAGPTASPELFPALFRRGPADRGRRPRLPLVARRAAACPRRCQHGYSVWRGTVISTRPN